MAEAKKTAMETKAGKFKIMTPAPFTFVRYDTEEGPADLWADEKGVIYTDDEAVKNWLLTFTGFQDATNV
ncbi:hypothetical protein [Listeria ilorinensis]|uniref:hypothetical protein n=1 Tax=Listeria ilorinensis TaxID=2867439 RepID=UPI001EF54CD3|nr:hypothetical protein [Listeria ilorinensis]